MEMGKTLIINSGSSSKKYAVFEEDLIFEKRYENEENSLSDFLSVIPDLDPESIQTVAIRIVSPGEFFQNHRLIDGDYIKKLEENSDTAPLHITPVLKEIRQVKEYLPHAQLLAISDSEFHKSIP